MLNRMNRDQIKALRGIWRSEPGGGTGDLMKERRAEREREEEKARKHGAGRPREPKRSPEADSNR